MATLQDFSIDRGEDATIRIVMTPPTAIGGWEIRFLLTKRFGNVSGIFQKSVASGYNNVSGINIINSGQGIFDVSINTGNTSGLNYSNFTYTSKRLNSGYVTTLCEGYLSIMPENG